MSNQISHIRVTAKKPLQQERTIFLYCFFFLRASIFSQLNKESMIRLQRKLMLFSHFLLSNHIATQLRNTTTLTMLAGYFYFELG